MKIRSLVFVCALTPVCLIQNATAGEKIKLDDDIVKILEENYRIYNARNAKKAAVREVAHQIYHAPGATKGLFQNLQSVVLPVCDMKRTPFGWNYIAPTEGEATLKYVGGDDFGPQFLRWTDSVWIRIAGPKKLHREGMMCGNPFSDGPDLLNYVAIEIDTSFAENTKNRNTPTELIDGALLQIASKVQSKSPRMMRGEVQLSTSFSQTVSLEIWCSTAAGPKKLAEVKQEFSNDEKRPDIVKVEASVDANSETYLILRLDPTVRDRAARGDVRGQIYLFDARLQPAS